MIELNVTELRHRLLDVIRQVEHGAEEVVVIRHGRAAARIVPTTVAPRELLGIDRGRVWVVDENDDLFESGEAWDAAS